MSLRLTALGLAVCLLGCGAAQAPVVAAGAPAVQAEKIDKLPEMESEIGGLNEEAMDKAFAALGGGVLRCVEQGSAKTAALGGELKVKLRIDRGGNARWAYVSSSTIGDRDTEKCVLDLARAKSWPLPVGGEGLAEKEFNVNPSKDPQVIEEKRVKGDVARVRAEALRCRRNVRGAFFATAYVHADGKVAAAGVAAPNENAEDASNCVVEAIRKLRFRSGLGKDAKVSFEIR